MDITGRPRMSRELMQRLVKADQSSHQRQVAAYGCTSRRHQLPVQRQRIAGYHASHMGSRSRVRPLGMEISGPTPRREQPARPEQMAQRQQPIHRPQSLRRQVL